MAPSAFTSPRSLASRWRALCWLLVFAPMSGCRPPEKTPTFSWVGRWEKTDLRGSYGSFIKMDDGRVARFGDIGLPKPICPSMMFCGGIGITVTREPGNLLTWTPRAPLMTWEAIVDLRDPNDPKKPAAERLTNRTTVVRLRDGNYAGLSLICRDHPAVDGLYYVASLWGSAESVNMVKEVLPAGGEVTPWGGLAGHEVPPSKPWEYRGKVKGPVGEYQDHVQTAYSMYTDLGNVIYLPDGPAGPDHAHPTRNRFLLFANYVGAPDLKKNGWLWTSLCYSADGLEWFFAKDPTGAVRNVTPFSDDWGCGFPFVFRHAPDEWWMWQTGCKGGFANPGTDAIVGVREIYLYYSPDGLNWRPVRKDLTCDQFPGPDGKPTGLKDMRIYYDDESDQIHGMLSVWDNKAQGWYKYHNIARVTGK